MISESIERHLLTLMVSLLGAVMIWTGKTTYEAKTLTIALNERVATLAANLSVHSHEKIKDQLHAIESRITLIEYQQGTTKMKKLSLERFRSDADGSLGSLFSDGKMLCYIAAPPWKQNRNNVSCIPAGTYPVSHLPRSASGRYRDVYLLHDVPGRSAILIHCGNLSGDIELGRKTDTHGCLLPGKRIGTINGQRAVLASKGALQIIHQEVNRSDFVLEVKHYA